MVFGLFEGNSVKVECDKPAYKRGDTINCTCTLSLKQPLKAEGITVEFWNLIGDKYECGDVQIKQLRETRMYGNGEQFKFSIVVDEKLFPDPSKADGVAKLAQALGGVRHTQVSGFMVHAILDVMTGFKPAGSITLDTDPPSDF